MLSEISAALGKERDSYAIKQKKMSPLHLSSVGSNHNEHVKCF